MSLIFDALKKADAARARSQAGRPDLQEEVLARSAPAGPASVFDPQAPLKPAAPPAWARPRAAIWLVAGAGVLGVLMLVFGPARREDAAPPVAPEPAVSAAPPAAQPAVTEPPAVTAPTPAARPSVPATHAPTAPKASTAPAPGARPPAAPAPTAQPAATPAAKPSAKAAQTTPPPAAPAAAAKSPAAPAAAAKAPAAPSTDAAPAALPALNDLPAEMLAAMPRLSVSGVVYSPDPSARMLLVNGQVLREGDAVAPGLVLERIGPRQAVLSWQGTRFQMKL